MTTDLLKRLAELREIESKATPGPWCQHPNGTSVWTGDEWTPGSPPDPAQRHIMNTTRVDVEACDNTEFVCTARNSFLPLIDALESSIAFLHDYPEALASIAETLKGERNE